MSFILVCYPNGVTDDTPRIRYPPQTTQVVTSASPGCSVHEFRQFGPFTGPTAKAKALQTGCLSRKQLTWALIQTETDKLDITLNSDDVVTSVKKSPPCPEPDPNLVDFDSLSSTALWRLLTPNNYISSRLDRLVEYYLIPSSRPN